MIVAAVCYLGGTKELSWLCVIGFILAGLNIITSIFTGGMVTLVSKILEIVVGVFWLIPKIFIEKAGATSEWSIWLVGNGANDIFYYARIFAIIFVFAVILEFISNIDALHGDN